MKKAENIVKWQSMNMKKQADEKNLKEKEAQMYAQNGPDCPVDSLKLYLSKLPFEYEALFQKS
jgi:hypothetical protein